MDLLLNPIWPGDGGGGGSARADFNLRELPCYLSNTNEILPLLLKFIGEQDSVKKIVKGITCCHGNPSFNAMFSQILAFFDFFPFNYWFIQNYCQFFVSNLRNQYFLLIN